MAALSVPAAAQKVSLSTDVPTWACLATLNMEGQVALAQHISIEAGVGINPWTWKAGGESQYEYRHQTYSLGARWWPWYVYSGWWLAGKAQYQEYNRGGIFSPVTEEGDAYGAGVSAGYSFQLFPWLNIDLGLGVWGGYATYTTYACPRCGKKLEEGDKAFVMPNEARLALMFIF